MNEHEEIVTVEEELEEHVGETPTAPEPPTDPTPPKLHFDAAGDKKTAEQWAEIKATPAWLFAATRAGLQWPRGQEMTEADFDAGIKWAATAPCR